MIESNMANYSKIGNVLDVSKFNIGDFLQVITWAQGTQTYYGVITQYSASGFTIEITDSIKGGSFKKNFSIPEFNFMNVNKIFSNDVELYKNID